MLTYDFSLSKTLNRSIPHLRSPFPNPLLKTLTLNPKLIKSSKFPRTIVSQYASPPRDVRAFAGRSKKNSGNKPPGRIEGDAAFRRRTKLNARRKSRKLAESLFYRLNNPNSKSQNHADNFTEDELQMIGKGYDRMVRFMDKDDPNLRHPHDWYKYGEYGPFSWRGVVVGEPIRGGFSDECVTLIGEVKNHEEWEKIEQFDMLADFGKRLKDLNESVGFRHYWVFVRHPKWRINESPWDQWTLVSEVVVEAGKKERLDKWSLMGRLGNKARQLVTKCAAWMRPDLIYVKRPVYQCRFEPQDGFIQALIPYLDPRTEKEFLFEVRSAVDGSNVKMCTYFGGLCRMLKVSPKAYVDDVVKKFEKLSDERKSECLGFLLRNHPIHLLHPWTKEWKAELEEMEMGCDAPDEDEDEWRRNANDDDDNEIVDWLEDYGEDDGDEEDGEDDGDDEDGVDEELGDGEENLDDEDEEKVSKEEFRKAISSSEGMEKLAKRSLEMSTKFYKKQMKKDEEHDSEVNEPDVNEAGDELAMRGVRAKVDPKEWETIGLGRWRKRIKKSRIPPELFLRAAVRPFTYRNLVKEIVLTRHAILDGDIGSNDDKKP